MPSRYLGLQNLRKGNFVQALLAVRTELQGIRPTHPQVPKVYAVRLLEADDDFGTRDGLVVQGDEVTWAMIDALFDLAVIGAETHRPSHADDQSGACPVCRQVDLVLSVQVAQRVRERRGSAR